ncbi:type II toxin-antitoxin system Phd/YefM family antitoxin [Sinorhizobium meliloti]|uniref:type II toxin-antitoxin system Phd/YefM family antitoxin n=1 Tax=Rhizobium meliloti TaxID=382 RepID=UPI0011715F82|nr:type II toxin-antitoxin system Phd/YefM family antitoxin [Sinorhizobium meliloti]MBP2468581.1 prevent-host-death family protein [Sinorhizobium meliloti]QND36363.1 type II toxin-antitoxin system Phd/YefM family antitoxin [Sinorhizobium meliloti]WGI78463.1 type II toxin-antitoxin system Phd/YefM family antitoxin [Sinorhizobium meliloti]WQO39330.1 type II toxin-antitoxin system Phd/YefM family antitoxin [Sinorhizobium meliloti]WQO79776.1 type II toxin-antitoxin system Phd/YefM family antitoxin
MSTLSLKDAKAGLSAYVDEAIRGEFATITRHGKPVAVLVPLAAAEIARKALNRTGPASLRICRFPGSEFERNGSPSRDVGL